MGVIVDVSESGMGWPLGIGLLVAAVSAGPRLVKVGKPAIKGAIRGYLVLQSKSKEMFAETSERLQDLYAEAKYEFDHQAEAGAAEEEHVSAESRKKSPQPRALIHGDEPAGSKLGLTRNSDEFQRAIWCS